jgi:hypothetical protein
MNRLLVLPVVLLAAAAVAQDKDPAYHPTELQRLQLEVLQKDAIIAQKDLQAAQQLYQAKLAALQQKADEVKHDNKWPPEVNFDPNSLAFSKAAQRKEEK